MYWPSTFQMESLYLKNQEGELLNPDKVLNRYTSWKDTSQWPISSRQTALVKSSIGRQADPLEKEGLIGAFCRAYTIQSAVEVFLSDIYRPSLMPERYDYIPADSTAGVLVYDDKFAYSHHATDPAVGKLCNAFDLVRIHKFHELDSK